MKPKKMVMGLIPNYKCNLRCEYCYISQLPDWMKAEEKFQYDAQYIVRCLSPERLGGTCLINLTGEGETMLQADIVELCRLLLEQGHYIELVTNLTVTKIVDEFIALPNTLLEQLEFKISFHYKELKRLSILDMFFANLNKIQNTSCSFTLELMPHDDLVGDIDSIINLCYKHVGAKCQVTVGRADYLPTRSLLSKYTREEYIEIWSKFDSPMFDLKMELLDVKRKEFCYAGAWTLYVNLYTGQTSSCYAQPPRQNIYANPDKPIKFYPVGYHCVLPYCVNGHAHISMGVIPEYDAPTYDVIRNRKRMDGSEWFSQNCKTCFGSKLSETNSTYGVGRKIANTIAWYFRGAVFIMQHPRKLIRRIRLFFYRRLRLKETTHHAQCK